MGTTSTLDPTSQNEDDYVSSEDEDFDPNAPVAVTDERDSSASDDEDNFTPTISKAQQRSRDREVVDLGFENSGDEATIKKGRKRKRKDGQIVDEESGGEGGFVKTRSMRAVEETVKKPLVSTDAATIDVDALWKSMNLDQTTTIGHTALEHTVGETGTTQVVADDDPLSRNKKGGSSNLTSKSAESTDMIFIDSPYVFAGVTSMRKKLVHKDSPEALAYLEKISLEQSPVTANHPPLRRPLKRPSRFEPNPLGIIKGLPTSANKGPKLRVVDKSKLDWQDQVMNIPSTVKGSSFATLSLPTNSTKAPKLNVVEKSKLDWAGYVDQEGIQDELLTAEKARSSYLARTEFLGRVEAIREGELKNARLK